MFTYLESNVDKARSAFLWNLSSLLKSPSSFIYPICAAMRTTAL